MYFKKEARDDEYRIPIIFRKRKRKKRKEKKRRMMEGEGEGQRVEGYWKVIDDRSIESTKE